MKVIVGTSDAVLDKAGLLIQADPAGWLGARMAGLFFSWMFLGMLLVQASHYYHFYPRDPLWIKLEVAFVVIGSILKTSQEVQILWDKCILHFGDYRNAARVGLSAASESMTGYVLSLAATIFFIHRAWLLTNKNWILIGVIVVMEITAFIFCVFLVIHLDVDPYYTPDTKKYGFPYLGLIVAIDVLITSVVSYKLFTSKRGFNKDTDQLINRLLRLSWESAFPPALFAILNLVMYELFHTKNLAHSPFNMITTRLYIFSFMYTLNIRGRLRLTPGTSQSGEGVSWSDEQTQRRGGVGLSVLTKTTRKSTGPQQHMSRPGEELPIRIQTETVAHVSSADEVGRHIKSEVDHKSQALGLEDSWSLSSSEQLEKAAPHLADHGRSVDFAIRNHPRGGV